MSSPVICKMRGSHIDEVHEIEKRVYPSPWSKSAFTSEVFHNSFAYYYVAVLDGKVVGYAGIWVILDEAHVTNLAVHPEYRRQGIGSMLLEYLLGEARNLGASRMTLEVRVSNTPAQELYLKYGFVPRGIRPNYYIDEDAVIMWLDDLTYVPAKKKNRNYL